MGFGIQTARKSVTSDFQCSLCNALQKNQHFHVINADLLLVLRQRKRFKGLNCPIGSLGCCNHWELHDHKIVSAPPALLANESDGEHSAYSLDHLSPVRRKIRTPPAELPAPVRPPSNTFHLHFLLNLLNSPFKTLLFLY